MVSAEAGQAGQRPPKQVLQEGPATASQSVGVNHLKVAGDRGQPCRFRLHIPKSPSLSPPSLPSSAHGERAQAAVTKLAQSCNVTREHIHNHKKK